MKKILTTSSTLQYLVTLVLGITLLSPVVTYAQENASATPPLLPPPPITGRLSGQIPQQIRNGYENRMQNIRSNQDYRNSMIQNNGQASTTFSNEHPRQEMRSLDIESFKERQAQVITGLQTALNNLKEIRGRIEALITKEQASSTDTTQAEQFLSVADTKISMADNIITMISAFTPSSDLASSTDIVASTTTSTIVDLKKPRELNESAIQAVNAAKQALMDVVQSLIKNSQPS